jgi:hypothetical protein
LCAAKEAVQTGTRDEATYGMGEAIHLTGVHKELKKHKKINLLIKNGPEPK